MRNKNIIGLAVLLLCLSLLACELKQPPVQLAKPTELAYNSDTKTVSLAANANASGYRIQVTGEGVVNPMTDFADITPELVTRGGVSYAEICLLDLTPALGLQNGALEIKVYLKGDGIKYTDSPVAGIEVAERPPLEKARIFVDFTEVTVWGVANATDYKFKVTGAGTVTPMTVFLPFNFDSDKG